MEAIVLTLKDRHVLMNGDSTLSVDPQGWTAGLCEEFDTFFLTVGDTTYQTRPMTDMEDTLYGYDPVSQYLEFLIEETTKAVAPGSLAASLKQQRKFSYIKEEF